MTVTGREKKTDCPVDGARPRSAGDPVHKRKKKKNGVEQRQPIVDPGSDGSSAWPARAFLKTTATGAVPWRCGGARSGNALRAECRATTE
jgi:hypothetical protein